MAIIVEDGTGKSDAQAYCDYAYFHAYLTERGIQHSHNQADMEAALVAASKDWVDGEHDYANEKLVSTQALKFPRTVFGLPADIKLATCRAADLHLHGALFVDYAALSVNGDIVEESSGLATLKDSVKYAEGTAQRYGRILPPNLTNLLKPYLAMGGGMKVYRG